MRTRYFFFVMQYEKDGGRWARVGRFSDSDNLRKPFSDKRLVAALAKPTLREAQEAAAMLNNLFKESGCHYFDKFIA